MTDEQLRIENDKKSKMLDAEEIRKLADKE